MGDLATDLTHIFDDVGAVFAEIKENMRGMLYQGTGRTLPPRSHYINAKLRQGIIKECRQTCQYCGMSGDAERGADGYPWHIDHIIPLAAPYHGPTVRSNLTLACQGCNLRKGKRMVPLHIAP